MKYMILPNVYSKCHWAEVYHRSDSQYIKVGQSINYTDVCTECGEPCEKFSQSEINQQLHKLLIKFREGNNGHFGNFYQDV